jgi:hypothetical protein
MRSVSLLPEASDMPSLNARQSMLITSRPQPFGEVTLSLCSSFTTARKKGQLWVADKFFLV